MSDLLPPPPTAPPPPPPSATPPPPAYPSGMMPPPPAPPGYRPPAMTPAAGGMAIGMQLRAAGWPIVIGVAGILLPVISAAMLGGNVYYFYILPIFGIFYGIRLMVRGVVIGGAIALVLNVVAGLASLTASGIFSSGG